MQIAKANCKLERCINSKICYSRFKEIYLMHILAGFVIQLISDYLWIVRLKIYMLFSVWKLWENSIYNFWIRCNIDFIRWKTKIRRVSFKVLLWWQEVQARKQICPLSFFKSHKKTPYIEFFGITATMILFTEAQKSDAYHCKVHLQWKKCSWFSSKVLELRFIFYTPFKYNNKSACNFDMFWKCIWELRISYHV